MTNQRRGFSRSKLVRGKVFWFFESLKMLASSSSKEAFTVEPFEAIEFLYDLLLSDDYRSAFYLFFYSFMKRINTKPKMNAPRQSMSPARDWPADYPFTIMLKKSPSKKPPKLPTANSSPTAEPYPTGKTSSHPSSSMMGTKGMRKNELKAETKLTRSKERV